MGEWTLHGEYVREQIEKDMKAEYLLEELLMYQEVFDDAEIDFELGDLLKIYEIKVKSRIAEAICNAPEFFMDQLGKARHFSEFHSISSELEDLNGHLEQFLENR